MHRHLPLLVAALATSLALAACAGPADDTAGLPTAEDLGADEAPVTSAMCVEDEPDCEDMIDPATGAPAGDAAASCLVGDPDCTDESFDGQDVTRPVPLADALPDDEDVQPAQRGTTDGATGRFIEQAALVDDDTVRLVVIGNRCMLVEDVLVIESPEEVRIMVLGGQDASVEACEDEGLSWSVDVDLDAPLGTRTLLDISG